MLTAAILVCSSALLYGLHYLVFHDAHRILIFLLGEIAFVPLGDLLVAAVIERIARTTASPSAGVETGVRR